MVYSDGIPDDISNSNSQTISVTIAGTISEHTEANSKAISNTNPKTVSESNSDLAHLSSLLHDGGLL